MVKLVDQWGRALKVKGLEREVAAPTIGGVRDVWSQTLVSGLTPLQLADILQQAAQGTPEQFFQLADEMEERDLHYRAVLGMRKNALTGVEPGVIAASESALDKKIADAVYEVIRAPTFVDDYVTDLLDALGKGYAVVETLWDKSATAWWPVAWKWRDQRFFQLDRRDGFHLRLKEEDGSQDGSELPAYKFSIHRPKLKSGLPIRTGLARLAAWAFLFKSYTLKDWMAFLEIYGMPLRLGKYGASSSHEERRVLIQAVRDLSSDAAAIIPKEMEIEFIEAAGGSGNAVFAAKAEYLDRQISKGVLGQTMTTDDGSSFSQARIHENVRHDIARADARQLALTANRDLIVPFVDINFGRQERYPIVYWPISENEDIKALSDALAKLVPLGLHVGAQEVRNKIGFSQPTKEEDILKSPDHVIGDEARQEGGEESKGTSVCADCGGSFDVSLTREHKSGGEQGGDHHDELDQLSEEALSDWEEDLEPLLKPFKKLVEQAKSYEDILKGLDELLGEMNHHALAARLAKVQMIARGLGHHG
ncbi:DUF935 domain-containing protein [Bartonella machadoae]|uniref:DUF935 domain-containing protein n=1 Tax=Bartonella machadoae TaxID=2893471 RepID=UPI001F4CDF16|nr:DUF935 domain-containing protein [Bartonella machadoae]UNE53518.1 DUF935 domain-containing protein [Bartonella machadoae]